MTIFSKLPSTVHLTQFQLKSRYYKVIIPKSRSPALGSLILTGIIWSFSKLPSTVPGTLFQLKNRYCMVISQNFHQLLFQLRNWYSISVWNERHFRLRWVVKNQEKMTLPKYRKGVLGPSQMRVMGVKAVCTGIPTTSWKLYSV